MIFGATIKIFLTPTTPFKGTVGSTMMAYCQSTRSSLLLDVKLQISRFLSSTSECSTYTHSHHLRFRSHSACQSVKTSRLYSSSALIRDSEISNQSNKPSSTANSYNRNNRVRTSSQDKERIQRQGQPLPFSHPHLFPQRLPLLAGANIIPPDKDGRIAVAEDELIPGISAKEFEERRRRLIDMLPEGSVVVCMSGRIKMMSGNIFYRFRQESNFLYLTGFQEPDSALILEKNSSSRGYRMTMFIPPHDQSSEVWNGPRIDLEGTQNIFGADEALLMEPLSFLQFSKKVLPSYDHVYVDPPPTPSIPRQSTLTRRTPSLLNFLAPSSPTAYDNFPKKADFDAIVKLLGDPSRCHSLSKEVHQLRLIKSENELKLMRRAGRIGSHAMMEVMQSTHPGRTEWQLQTIFESSCAMQGAQRPAYVPVVASGANALTIHYVQNDDVCQSGQLVCMDAGCEMDGYVSDITRAFPIDGHFSSPQRDLYGAILNVLKACTKLVSEDQGYTLSALHRRSVEMLNSELRRLGFNLPAGSLERDLYPHALSHWLGLDLHDTPTIDRNTQLRSGMCLSVEPAVYCQEGMPGVPSDFWGLGIRIEDDVAVYGEKGNIILNAETPKEIEDVESVCSNFWQKQHSSQHEFKSNKDRIQG